MHDYINAKVQWPSEDWRGERVIDTYQDPCVSSNLCTQRDICDRE